MTVLYRYFVAPRQRQGQRGESSNSVWSAKIYTLEAQTQHRQQLGRGGEDVAQMEAETLLSNDGKPPGEVALTKGRPCEAGMAHELGEFSGIGARRRLGRL